MRISLEVCQFSSTLIEEGTHALSLVVGVIDDTKEIRLHLNSILDIHIVAIVDRSLGNAVGIGTLGDNLLGHLMADGVEIFPWNNLIDQANAVSLLGIDVIAGEDKLLSVTHANQTGKTLGAAESGDNTQAGLGLAKEGVVRGNPDITGHGNLVAAAEGKTVDSSDGYLTHVHEPEERLGGTDSESSGLGSGKAHHLVNVSASNKGAVGIVPAKLLVKAGAAGKNQPLNIVSCLNFGQSKIELLKSLSV